MHATPTHAPTAEFTTTLDENVLHAAMLIRLRWFALVAQTLAGVLALEYLHLPVRLVDFLIVIACSVLFNLIAHLRLSTEASSSENWLLGSLAFDLYVLTGLLFVSGGALNPFSSLYIIQVAIASVMLSPRRTALVVALSALAFAVLFVSPSTIFGVWQDGDISAQPIVVNSYHLAGIWIAHLVAAISVAFFTSRLSQQRRRHQQQAIEAAVQGERSRRLASLAALATGAAHEIATPLSTIAVAASELEDMAAARGGSEDLLEDARLIRQEVARCRSILDRMAIESGYVRGDSVLARKLDDFLDDALTRVHHRARIRITKNRCGDLRSTRFNGALAHALAAVLNNATLASTGDVDLLCESDASHVRITVRDEGVGMSPEVIAHATEPFFTTRDAGHGMGLGLFLAYNVTRTMGGQLEITSRPGVGTAVRFILPRDEAAEA